jgi:transcriptional regulator of acetoin/glycerol metabolism
MTGTASEWGILPDATEVAVNRLRFLTSEPLDRSGGPTGTQSVRPPILASWRRSRALKVAADKIELPYLRDPNMDTPLIRSAEPLISRLHAQLAGQAVSIVLTDPAGLVLIRRTADAGLERHLDKVRLAPGFSYAEQFVGTNGIGTALEAGSATQVFGHEHYAEHLETLACAGVPIHDPISGRVVGLIDLTCWRKDAEALLLTLAKNTADQIQQALLTNSGVRELAVLQAYRQTCRRTGGAVFAVTNDAFLINDHARAELEAPDQAALLAQALEAGTTLAAGRRRSVDVLLPTGSPARMYCQQVGSDSGLAGLVVHVKLGPPDDRAGAGSPAASRMLLPGLVGNAPLWQRACREIEAAVTSGDWVAVEGEPGVGKSALLRAVQLRRQPPRRCTVLDADDAATDPTWMTAVRRALTEDASVVVAHVDVLDGRTARTLAAALQERTRVADGLRTQVAVTRRPGPTRDDFRRLMSFFPTTVSVPPLRLRVADLSALVPFLLGRFGPGGRLTLSPDAMRLLMRYSWPGNVQQLENLLHQMVQQRRAGQIDAKDLPPEMHSVSRRVLSTLESMERDAIVRSLADSHGNKVQAARSLGMSRATIYRRIREFGIVPTG